MPGQFGTGPALLNDIGELTYNNVTFSSLFRSKLSGKTVLDTANKAKKWMEWSLEAEGVVTLTAGAVNTDNTFLNMRLLLETPGQKLIYSGRGSGLFNVNFNPNNPQYQDCAWGPTPEVLNFQNLGAGRGALCSWKCTVRLPDTNVVKNAPAIQGPASIGNVLAQIPAAPLPVVEFTYESTLSYDDEGYATVHLSGTLEIPLTRGPQNQRAITQTVDDFRQGWLNITVDLTKYKVVRREFRMSRDKRTYEWEYEITELSPAGLPVGHTGARGTMSFRNMRPGGGTEGRIMALPRWICSMKCTYALRSDFPRRIAFMAFLSLLWFRMWSVLSGDVPAVDNNGLQQQAMRTLALQALQNNLKNAPAPNPPAGPAGALAFYEQLTKNQKQAALAALTAILQANQGALAQANKQIAISTPLLADFGFDEGLMDDAKTITFQAAWIITTSFTSIMAASGCWNYAQDVGGNNWATSIGDIMGWRSALAARIDPSVEVIVDMGGGAPLSGPPVTVE
jgi:hypothetical protein